MIGMVEHRHVLCTHAELEMLQKRVLMYHHSRWVSRCFVHVMCKGRGMHCVCALVVQIPQMPLSEFESI